MLGVSGNKPDKCGMYSLTSQDSMAAEWDEVHPGVVLQVYPFLSSIFSRLSVLVDQMNLFCLSLPLFSLKDRAADDISGPQNTIFETQCP